MSIFLSTITCSFIFFVFSLQWNSIFHKSLHRKFHKLWIQPGEENKNKSPLSRKPGQAGTRKVKPVSILMRQDMMTLWDAVTSAGPTCWTTCKQSAPLSFVFVVWCAFVTSNKYYIHTYIHRYCVTMPTPHPDTQPTALIQGQQWSGKQTYGKYCMPKSEH